MSKTVSILLTHYKDIQVTLRCIESLLKDEFPRFNIIVVDNSSCPEDKRIARDRCACQKIQFQELESIAGKLSFVQSVFWYASPSNTGYSGGMNLGAEIAKAGNPDYLLILNNDAVAPPGFLHRFMDEVEPVSRQPGFGFASCLIRGLPEKEIWYAGGTFNPVRGTAVHFTEKPANDQIQETGFISGCCMFCKTNVYRDLAGMDERFFLYLEDVDLCLRAEQKGYKLYFVPGVELYHQIGSSTGGEDAEIPVYYSTRNRIRLMKKHYHGLVLYRFFGFFLASRLVKTMKWALTGKVKLIPSLMKGFKDGCVG